MKETLGDVVADVRASDRLTESAVCLVAPEHAMDRQLEKLLAGAGRLDTTVKPVLEINPHHRLVEKLSAAGGSDEGIRTDAAHSSSTKHESRMANCPSIRAPSRLG